MDGESFEIIQRRPDGTDGDGPLFVDKGEEQAVVADLVQASRAAVTDLANELQRIAGEDVVHPAAGVFQAASDVLHGLLGRERVDDDVAADALIEGREPGLRKTVFQGKLSAQDNPHKGAAVVQMNG